MKFATAKEHRDFFQKNGWIEFEGLIPNEQLNSVNQAIDQVLADRLNTSSDRLHLLSSEKLFLQGRDVWRSNPSLQKFISQTRFAEIVTELIDKRPLRLGYDEFFPARQQDPSLYEGQESSSIYSRFLHKKASLEEVSCVKNVACGFLIALGEKETLPNEREASVEGADVFPSHQGNIIFFQPHALVNWSELYAHPGQRYYMIVYAWASSFYQLQPEDPHTHALKRLGYIFNDKLSDKLNPIIYR